MVVLPNIIWLDQNCFGDETMGYISELRFLGYYNINCFKTINESIEYLKKIKFQDTIIIVSGSLYIPFIKEFKAHLNEICVIPKIIIFTANIKEFIQNNAKDLNNINPYYLKGGLHTNFQEIKNFILNQSNGKKNVFKRKDEGDLIFEYIDCQEKLALPTLYKTLIEVTPNDKIEEFTQNLYNKYSKNQKIEELLEPILSMSGIPNELLSKYYTRIYTIESPFYYDLNKELRKNNNRDNEYLPFIKVLYEGVKLESLSLPTKQTLYRGSSVADSEIKKIYDFIKMKKPNLPAGIVFSKSFLSFTKAKSIAENFLEKQTPKGDGNVKQSKILFILESEDNIDYSLSTHADIEQLADDPREREVLFFPFSSFEIKEINWNEDKKRYEIKLLYLGKNEYIKQLNNQKEILSNKSIKINDQNLDKASSTNSANISNRNNISCYSNVSELSQNHQNINNMGNIPNNNPTLPIVSNQPNIPNSLNISNLPDSTFKNLIIESGLIEPKKIESNNNTAKLMKTYEDYKKKQIQIKKAKINNSQKIDNISIPHYPKNYIIKRFEIPENEGDKLIPLQENKILLVQEDKIIPIQKKTKNLKGINEESHLSLTITDPNSQNNIDFKTIKNNTINNNTINNNTINYNPIYKTNYITGTINITENDINKDIRIINSYENFFKKVDNDLRYTNESEILNNCEIKINNKKLKNDFFYFVKISEPGNYTIEYSFKKNLSKTDFMFANCTNLVNLDLLNFHAQNVTNMAYMFYQCSSLRLLRASNLETNKVKDMSNMFNGCIKLEQLDLSSINTKNVNNMSRMFFECRSLKTLNLNNFKTKNVNNMYCMFFGCQSLTELDLSSFNTDNVKNMSRMFSECKSLTKLNISNFNTINTNYMYNLFNRNSSLTNLNISSLNIDNAVNKEDMFFGCRSLRPQNIICKRNVFKKVNYFE